MNWYLFWRLVHLAGVVVFVAGHGVSVAVTVRLPRERDRARLEGLLSLSRSSIPWSNVGLLVLLAGGVANWIRVDYSPQGWLWVSAAILAVLAAVGLAVAAPYFRRVRSALGAQDRASLDALLTSRLPRAILWVETVGTAAIVWLMVYKPF
ncbi:MAG TPA: DUF2269 family protein [Actinomycetota bacterium]